MTTTTETPISLTEEERRQIKTKRRRKVAVRRWVLVAGMVLSALAVAWLGLSQYQIIQDGSTIKGQNATITRLTLANLVSQNHHHAATVKTDDQLKVALTELKAAAAAIEYEGGVIAYQNGEIIAAQQSGHATLMVIQALQTEVSQELPAATAALKAGQAQINAYLHFLTCIGTNPTNTAVCGAAPPLPPTL